MKDGKGITPQRMYLLNKIDDIEIEIQVMLIGYRQLPTIEKAHVDHDLHQLYIQRSQAKRLLRKNGGSL